MPRPKSCTSCKCARCHAERLANRALLEALATEVRNNTAALSTLGPVLTNLATSADHDWLAVVNQLNKNTQVMQDFSVVMGRVIRILDSKGDKLN